MTDEPYKDPEHAIPYLKLIKLGVPTWNKWIKGELTAEEAVEVAASLAPTPVPEPPTNYPELSFRTINAVNFSGVKFCNRANFSGAVFVGSVDFSHAEFVDWALFRNVLFMGRVSFSGTKFYALASFLETVFSEEADFSGASFSKRANFSAVEFTGRANFSGTEFGSLVLFLGGDSLKREKRLKRQAEHKLILESRRDAWVKARLENEKKDLLSAINFSGARFRGSVNFSNRQFKDYVIFSHVQFDRPPTFENCDGMDRLDVTGTKFGFTGRKPKFWWWEKEQKDQPGWTTNSNIPTRLRILRKQMEDIKAHDAERDLFIAERMAERGVLIAKDRFGLKTIGALFLFFMYQTLSDCGRGILRPFMWFMGKMVFFFTLYGLMKDAARFFRIYDIPNGWPGDFLADLLSFTLGHALPFATSLSPVQTEVMKRLFGDKLEMPLSIELLSIGQSLIGALLLFLFLQAIRNHFRLR